ncbi:MAG: hypothetical protein NTX03_12495 [Bacteroidetes bacterium]|nr:hypothetical protein [Bacteroidota bacterium]
MNRLTKFQRFYTDLFEDVAIIDSRLQAFCRFVLAAFAANNPGGVLTPYINALQQAYDDYFTSFNDRTLTLADRKSATNALDIATRNFADGVRAKYGRIIDIFPKDNPIYNQFFPQGLTEYSKLTRLNVLTVSHRFAVKANQYKAQLGGQPFADLFAGYETAIINSLSTQNTDKANVQTASGGIHANRTPVEDALMKCLYGVGNQFWPNSILCNTYFDFSLLFSDHPDTGHTHTGEVAANAIALAISGNITSSTIFTLKNDTDFPMHYFITDEEGVQKGALINVPPHSQHIAPFAEFGVPNAIFTYVRNDNPLPLNWEIRLD